MSPLSDNLLVYVGPDSLVTKIHTPGQQQALCLAVLSEAPSGRLFQVSAHHSFSFLSTHSFPMSYVLSKSLTIPSTI